MLNRRSFQAQESLTDDDAQIRAETHHDGWERDLRKGQTIRFTLPGSDVDFDALDASDAALPPPAAGTEARAYLIMDDGAVLADIPCDENAGILTIGRGKIAEIRLNDPYVHRLQAEIRWDEQAGTHILAHGGGENSTYVNQRAIEQPHPLQGGERLRFGKTTLTYKIRK